MKKQSNVLKKYFFILTLRIKQTVFFPFLCGLLIACDQQGEDVFIKQSPNDNRMYRYLELPNKMRVLIASDPSSDKSAAALTVYRGSYHNPETLPLLADF